MEVNMRFVRPSPDGIASVLLQNHALYRPSGPGV